MEISGRVVDSAGQTAWDIAGRWDSQLVARRAGSSSPLNADTQVKDQKEYLLLWRNSEKPKAPFNLTPFAITLVRANRMRCICADAARTTYLRD